MPTSFPRLSADRGSRLDLADKARLALRVWLAFLRVRLRGKAEPLPSFTARWGRPDRRRTWIAPERLSRAVDRSLRLGGLRPTCLTNSLVLFRLLREQGDPAELVIGLPASPRDHEAHAWVELEGRDVGPPPGRHGHDAMARFR